MSTLHDDDIRTIGETGRLDPQADADGDDTDSTDGDATDGARPSDAIPTRPAFVAGGYGRDRGRRIAPASAALRHRASS